MTPKFPQQKTAVNELGRLNGLQILSHFKSNATHALSQDRASDFWKCLLPYLWADEEEDLFVAWEHLRFGRGISDLVDKYSCVRDRMENGRFIISKLFSYSSLN